MKAKSAVKVGAAAAVTAAALWLSFRKVDFGALRVSFTRADYGWVAAAVVVSLLAVVVLSWRWKLLLRAEGDIPLARLYRLNIISQYVNILMPGRFGEPVKAYLVSRGTPVHTAYALGTVAIEKVLDFFVFLGLWVLVPMFVTFHVALRDYTAAAALGVVVAGVMAVFIFRPQWMLRVGGGLLGLLPRRFRPAGREYLERGVETFGLLRNPKFVLVQAALTVLVLAGEIGPNLLLFRAMGLDPPFWAAIFVLIAVQVGNLPPSLPGKIGIFQYAVILALLPFGVGRDEALGYGIMLHVVTFVPRILLGMVFLFLGGLKLPALTSAATPSKSGT